MSDDVVAFKHAFCPECGPVENCDEDICCLTCGADIIVGAAFDELMATKAKAEAALCRARKILDGGGTFPEWCERIRAALSSSACPHAAELARVRGIPDDGTFHHRLGVDGLFGVMSRMEICRLLREHIEGRPPVDRTAEETPKEGFDYDEPFPCACCGKNSTNYLCGKCCKDRRAAKGEEGGKG